MSEIIRLLNEILLELKKINELGKVLDILYPKK